MYSRQLAEALARTGRLGTLVLWCGSAASAAIVSREAPPGARIVVAGPIARLAGLWGRLGRWSPLSIERLVGPVDVFHSPNYFLPARHGHAARVVTIHDLSVLKHPEWHPPKRVLLHRLALMRTARSVDHVITPTEAIRCEVIDGLRLPPSRVTAIHHGVTDAFRPRSDSELRPALARYGLTPGGYLAYVGALDPRKNLERLVTAVSLVARGRPKMPSLVVAGPLGWRSAAVRARLTTSRGIYVGFLRTPDVALLMAGALALVYPSLYEGFGLPVLEAMACGIPVITSEVGGLAEVTGDCAVIVDPENVESIAAGIMRTLDDADLRRDLGRRGLARARAFSWSRAATETLRVYEMCHPGSGGRVGGLPPVSD